jgi:hypothetical protein
LLLYSDCQWTLRKRLAERPATPHDRELKALLRYLLEGCFIGWILFIVTPCFKVLLLLSKRNILGEILAYPRTDDPNRLF